MISDAYEAKSAFSKFADKEFRLHQREVIEDVFHSTKKVSIIKGSTGSGKCVNKNTLVYSDKGIFSIGKMLGTSAGLLSFDSTALAFTNNKILDEYSKDGVVTKKVITDLGYSLEGTPEHKIMIFENGVFSWRCLNDLKVGDVTPIYVGGIKTDHAVSLDDYTSDSSEQVGSCVTSSISGRFKYKLADIDCNSTDFMYFVGLCIAEGCIYKGNKKQYDSVSITTADLHIDRFLQEFSGRIGLHMSKVTKPNNKASSYVFGSVDLAYKLSQLGLTKHAKDKRIPVEMFNVNLECKKSLLAGMFDGDGYINNTVVSYTTASIGLANDLQQLLLSIGIVSGIKYKQIKFKDEYFDS
jgi:intein/homing endonuclease